MMKYRTCHQREIRMESDIMFNNSFYPQFCRFSRCLFKSTLKYTDWFTILEVCGLQLVVQCVITQYLMTYCILLKKEKLLNVPKVQSKYENRLCMPTASCIYNTGCDIIEKEFFDGPNRKSKQ